MHNSKRGAYPDVSPLYLEDGAWVFKYSSQSASVENWLDQRYSQKMINCMECGVPVGVFFATGAGYKVLGLAFVERYEPENGWFVLHGPVHKGGPDARFYPDMSYMKDDPIAAEFSGASASDDEKVRYALRRERIGQQRFRTQLFEAYTGRCAVSGCNVDEALEAAHIENYSGPKSQVVSNGILLRRDLHSLFDAHLISFKLIRGDYQLCGSYLLQHTDYAAFAGSVLREPDEHHLRPNARFLEAHRAEFDFSESRRHAEAIAPD